MLGKAGSSAANHQHTAAKTWRLAVRLCKIECQDYIFGMSEPPTHVPTAAPGPRVVVQARIGSSRLPGKIMAPLGGRPMLEILAERLRHGFSQVMSAQVVIATTTCEEDDRTADLCRRLEIVCVRGRPNDVLDRYVQATADLPDNAAAMRATGDNPLYCPNRAREIWQVHCQEGADYTCVDNLSYVVPEVFRVGALRAMAATAKDAHCREHVTPYFRREGAPFRVVKLPPTWRGLRPDVRLTVDTPAELARMQRLFDLTASEDALFPLERAYELHDAGLLGP